MPQAQSTKAPPSLLDTVMGWRGQNLGGFLCSGWSWMGQAAHGHGV